MKRLAASLAAALLAAGSVFAAEPSAQQFLDLARRPPAESSYARLSGTLQHRKDGGEMQVYPIAFAIVITPAGSHARLVIDGKEQHTIIQLRKGDGTAETQLSTSLPAGQAGIAAGVGLHPADLTTGFLFYRLVKEESSQLVKGMSCRVLDLEAPDKSETARVYLLAEHVFPIRTEFFRSTADLAGKPLRTMDVGSFKQQNGLYYAELINLHGAGWRSRVQFTEAEIGGKPPADIFPEVK